MEARQHPGGVVVVEELSAELQVQLSAELADAGADVLRLHFQVFFVVEAKSFDHVFASSHSLYSVGKPAEKKQQSRFDCTAIVRKVNTAAGILLRMTNIEWVYSFS